MTYDCTFIFNELDTLEIRLNTLSEVVDKFILVEASWTHTGKSKEYIFDNSRERFRPFLDRIIHIKLTDADLPPLPTDGPDITRSWIRENTQRNAVAKGLSDAKLDDVIIISDLDEIPSPESVRQAAKDPHGITNVVIRNYSFWLNNANVSAPYHYLGPKILTVATFRDPHTYDNIGSNPCAPKVANRIPSATLIRFLPASRTIFGGWHFSSQGGIERIKTKINSIADGVFVDKKYQDIDKLAQQIMQGNAMTPGVKDVLIAEPLTHNFPSFIVNNQKRLADQLLPTTEESWNKTRIRRRLARIHRVIYDKWIGLLIGLVPKSLHPICSKIRKRLRF